MGSFYATGAVYFLWPVLILTLIFEYAWCALSLAAAFRAFSRSGAAAALKKHLFSVFVTSVGCDAALTAALYVLYFVSEARPGLAAALDAPFSGAAGTLAALFVIALVLLAGLVKYVLYRRVVLLRAEAEEEKRIKMCALLAALTTPWLYLIPTRTAYAVLGSVMMAIGRLAPGDLPSALPPE